MLIVIETEVRVDIREVALDAERAVAFGVLEEERSKGARPRRRARVDEDGGAASTALVAGVRASVELRRDLDGLGGGGTGTPVARGGAWGRQSRSETNARRDASRTRDSKRSYRSEPAVSGWRVEVASGPTSVGRQPTRARAVRACAKSTSWRRSQEKGRMGRQGGRAGTRDTEGTGGTRGPEGRRRTRRSSDDDGPRRTSAARGSRSRARRHEGR